MPKRRVTASYLFFYLLFSDDTWRLAAGFACAVVLGPMATRDRDMSQSAEVMVWLMIMAIGWSLTAWPARKITAALKRALHRVGK